MENKLEINPLVLVRQRIESCEKQYITLADKQSYLREAGFIYNILQESKTLLEIAINNPTSLKKAMLNLARTDLTLNPTLQLAYFIPRNGKICLDISYKGYIEAGNKAGITLSARGVRQTELDNGAFEYHYTNGNHLLQHTPSLFSDEPFIGYYACAYHSQTNKIVAFHLMTTKEIEAVRNTYSQSYKSEGNKSIWAKNFNDMALKTVLRKLWNYIPKSEHKQLQAIQEVLDDDSTIQTQKQTIIEID